MAKTAKRRNRRGRRGTPGCLSVLFLLVCVIAAVVAAVFIFFKVRYIDVVGVEHYTPEQVVAASGAETGSNLIVMSKGKITHGIFDQLPYISQVRISRSLPDTLVITVEETYAVGYAYENGGYWLIDPSGKLLESRSEEPAGLIRLDGVKLIAPRVGSTVEMGEESELRLRTFVTTVGALEKAGFIDQVQSMDLGGVYDVSVSCCGRFEVDFGAPEELDYKLEYLSDIINNKLRPNQKGSIDLSGLIDKGEARFLEDY